jgi:hypothetical protein
MRARSPVVSVQFHRHRIFTCRPAPIKLAYIDFEKITVDRATKQDSPVDWRELIGYGNPFGFELGNLFGLLLHELARPGIAEMIGPINAA